jgi:DNA-binding MarR family transcriptional regulator
MKPRATQRGKTQRAYGAYLDLVDTADWIRRELAGPLATFGLTMNEFRFLAMLFRDGPVTLSAAAGQRGCNRQNLHVLILRLRDRGWVRWEITAYAAVEVKESHLPKAMRGKTRTGPRVGVAKLAPAGENLIGCVLPKQAKLVKSLMRALDGREQQTLSRLCRKLRERDVLRFVREITHLDSDEDLLV